MAHTRIVDKDARIIAQCARGRYIRNVTVQNILIAAAQISSAPTIIFKNNPDVTNSGNCVKGMLIAPSDAKVESIYLTGNPYPVHHDSGGVTYVQFYRSRLGGTTVPFLSDNTGLGLQIGGTLASGTPVYTSALTIKDGAIYSSTQVDLLAGDAIYCTVSASAIFVSAASLITACLEWRPDDKSYASS